MYEVEVQTLQLFRSYSIYGISPKDIKLSRRQSIIVQNRQSMAL